MLRVWRVWLRARDRGECHKIVGENLFSVEDLRREIVVMEGKLKG